VDLTPASRAGAWVCASHPRLAPGATVLRPLCGLGRGLRLLTPGLRLGLPSYARFAGWGAGCACSPQARAWGYLLTPASRAGARVAPVHPRLAPGATFLRPLRGLGRGLRLFTP